LFGPIADALVDASGARFVVHCPSYPENDRTVYLGGLRGHDIER